jgi:hypothetical protein
MGNRVGRQQQVLEVTSTFGKGVDENDQENDKPTLEPISEVEEPVATPDYSRIALATPFADPRAQHVATYNVKFVHMN